MSLTTTAQAAAVEIEDIVQLALTRTDASGGPPATLIEFDIEVSVRSDAPAGYWIQDFGIEYVASYSSWDLGFGDLTSDVQFGAMDAAAFALHPEASFSTMWFIDPGGETPPTFSVSESFDTTLPLTTFGPGSSPFNMFVDITSATDTGDGISLFRFTGTVVPAPSTGALLLVGTGFLRRRRR